MWWYYEQFVKYVSRTKVLGISLVFKSLRFYMMKVVLTEHTKQLLKAVIEMAKKQKSNAVASPEESSNLKGTFIMVMILGVLMVGAWFGAYWLFISR